MAFIDIFTTLDEALSNYESPITHFFDYRGVQLIPNEKNPYTQITSNSNGVELEDWQVYAVSLCGTKTDITSSFAVFDNFTDENGKPQIIWTLTNLPELGTKLIYLEIKQLFGVTYYTNVFVISDYKKELTARFDYRNSKFKAFESIQMRTWFRQYANEDEIKTYYEISTKNTVSIAKVEKTFEIWHTELFNNNLMKKFRSLLNSNYLYVNLYRANLISGFEIPKLDAGTSLSEQQYSININKNEILNENINEMALIDEINELKAIVKPIVDGNTPLLFMQPAYLIPAGYVEYTGLAGLGTIGRLEGDPDFGTFGATIGSKTFTLTEANLPSHTHRMFVNASQDISENRINLFPDRNATYRGTGEGSADHDYTISSSTTAPTLGKTGASGSGTAVKKLDPNRIVNYIIWSGL